MTEIANKIGRDDCKVFPADACTWPLCGCEISADRWPVTDAMVESVYAEIVKPRPDDGMRAAIRRGLVAMLSAAPTPGAIPDDVRRLVIAAREVAFDTSGPTTEALKELDAASEAFASRVPWENDPNDEADDDR